MLTGRIVKHISGMYYVSYQNEIYSCRATSKFRYNKVKPLVGDVVKFQIENESDGYILEIEKRNNELMRPPISNVDQVFIIISCKEPKFQTNLLDRLLAIVEFNNIEPIIVITKIDLLETKDREEINNYVEYYRNCGYEVITTSSILKEGIEDLKPYFTDKISVFAGQSGVGKSTLFNVMDETLNIKTNEISKALGRGKHTTRHVELISLNDGLVADTPGFSSLDFVEMDLPDLASSFIEFFKYSSECKFRGCLHINEPKCKVKDLVNEGVILEHRYENYLKFVEEIKNRKPRY